MVCQLRQLLLKQVIEDLNFNLNPNHLGVEIYRQYRLDEESENPKGFFFNPQIFDKSTEYKIHALTISDHRISFWISGEYVPQESHDPLPLVVAVLGVCTV